MDNVETKAEAKAKAEVEDEAGWAEMGASQGGVTDVLLMLGSNIEPESNIRAALTALRSLPDSSVKAISSVYRTPAIGADGERTDQADFYNAAVRLKTALTAAVLQRELRTLEAQQGRVRTADKFAPRTLDIDITFFGRSSSQGSGPIVPDPEIECLPHLALPLAEIAPMWTHPSSGRTLGQIAERLASHEMELVQL